MLATPHLRILYPTAFAPEATPVIAGVECVLAMRGVTGPFRPNIVFTAVPSEAPLIDAAHAAVRAAAVDHPGARILSVDLVFGEDDSRGPEPFGRVVTFSYPASAALDVIVKKWIVATGTHHLHFSASYLPSQALAVEETFDWIAANVEFTAPTARIHLAARGESLTGVQRDDAAASRAGFPLEDLSVIERPPLESARAHPAAAARLLADAWGIELSQPRALHAIVTRGQARGFYAAYPGSGGICVVRSAGASALDCDATRVEAYGLSPERLPADAAAWLDVAPASRFDGGTALTKHEYAARIAAPSGDAAWTEVQFGSAGLWTHAVHIAGEGYSEAVAPDEDTIELRPLPSGRFFDLIIRSIAGALTEAPNGAA